jgi:citrate lyase synthetase
MQPANRRVRQKVEDRILREILSLVPLDTLRILSQLDEHAQGCVSVANRIKK